MTSDEIWGQIQDALGQYQNAYQQWQSYGDQPGTFGDVYGDLASRVDYFRPQYQELADLEAQAYAAPATELNRYMQQYGPEGTSGMYGPDAMSVFESMLGSLGRGYGTVDAFGNMIGQQQGRLEQMSQNILDQYQSRLGQYQAQQNALYDQYQMLLPQWQTVRSEEEAARQRAWEAQQAELDRQTQMAAARLNIPPQEPEPTAQVPDRRTAIEALKNMPRIGQVDPYTGRGATFEERVAAADYVMSLYPDIDPYQAYSWAGISHRMNPAPRY